MAASLPRLDGICAFARELLVSDSTVSDMRHSHLKAVAVANEVLFGGAIVVAEHLGMPVPPRNLFNRGRNPFNPQPLISHLTNSNGCGNL